MINNEVQSIQIIQSRGYIAITLCNYINYVRKQKGKKIYSLTGGGGGGGGDADAAAAAAAAAAGRYSWC